MITFEDLPPMEEKCRECNGIGSVPWVYETRVGKKKKLTKVNSSKTCDKCYGKGKFLTPFGQSLIKLVKEWSPWDQELDDIKSDIRDLENREPYDRQRD